MGPTKEQFYPRRIAKLERQNAELHRQNSELRAQVAKLAEQVARLSKNSSNSSKPPSSDIVKPPKGNNTNGPRRQGGQAGHHGRNRPTFRPDQIDRIEELHPPACPCCHDGNLEPTGQVKIQSA